MFIVRLAPDVQHIRAVQRQRAAEARTRDHMAEAERANAAEHIAALLERNGIAIGDFFDGDQRLALEYALEYVEFKELLR